MKKNVHSVNIVIFSFVLLLCFAQQTKAQSITNYSFAATSGTFAALSGASAASSYGSGTADEGQWNNVPIGFDFWYMGIHYTTISASSNGWLTFGASITAATPVNNLTSGGAPRPILAPLWDDLNIQNGAFASYLTSGSAGSRIFTLQFLNYKWDHVAAGSTISFQVKLYEATGKIQYIYRPESGGVNSTSASIGIAATATGAGNFLSLNGTGATPTASSVTETTSLSTKPVSGQTYSFTPPVPSAPTSLTFTAVSGIATTLNWIDNSSNETGFVIYRSLDGTTYSYITQTTANATSSVQTGLSENTTYYWKVYAVTEGALSTAVSGNQLTTCDAPVLTATTTGNCVGGTNTGTITASATGGAAPYTYSLNSGIYQSSASFTGLAAGTYTLAVKSNTGCVASISVVVSQYGISADDQNATGTNSWIGHVYDGTAFTTYAGQITETEAFNESFGGSTTCFNILSNAVTSSIYTESFSVKFRMNSTKRGLYAADLGSDDGTRLTVDGTMVYNNWADQSFGTKPSVLFNLTGSSSLLYEYYENTGFNQVVFQNLTLLLANTLSSNTTQNICTEGTGTAISGDVYGILPSGISLSGTGYQWTYSTTMGGTRINIPGATGATFTPSSSNVPFNTPGTYYVYRNAVLSSANNVSPGTYVATNESNAATITVKGPVISQVPAAGIIAYYKFAGNAYDATNNNTGTLQNAPAQSTDRFGNANSAYTFNGSSQYVSTANAYTNPSNFTLSVWFKTNSVTGGKLIGFGTTQVGTSGQYDRNIYMNNAGQIYFGVYSGGVVTVNSALSYNDNTWHLATATLSSATGLALYIDGVLVGSNTMTTTAENTTGYWKIGFDNLNSWTSAPTSAYFSGSLDDVLIYSRALTFAEITALYNSPDGAGNNGPACLGSSLSLSATTVSGATYSWTGPAGFTSALQNPSFTYATANAGVYTLQVTTAGCSATAYTIVTSSVNAGQWTGNTSTNWTDAGNWCNGVVPTAATNVIISSSATRMPSISSSVVCNNLNINSGATLTTTLAGTLNISGTLTNSGTMANNGTANFNGTSGQQTFSGVASFNNLEINNINGLVLPAAITVNNNLTLNAGTLTANNFNININGNWTNNVSASAFAGSTATVTFNGGAAQLIGGTAITTFNNIEFDKTVGSTAELTGNIIIAGDLTVNSGTLDIKSFDCNRSAAGGTFTLADAATFIVGANNLPQNFSNNLLAPLSTVIADGISPQNIPGLDFGNLVFRNGGIKTLVSSTDVKGNLTIESSATFDCGSQTLSLDGNWTNNGTFIPSSGTVVCTGNSKSIAGLTTFNKLTIAGSYTLLSDVVGNGLLNINSSGSLSAGPAVNAVLYGDFTNSGSLNTSGAITFAGTALQTISVINAVQTQVLTANFNGTVSPVFNSTSSAQFGYLNINNTGGINPDAGWYVLYNMTVGTGASFNGGNSTHNILGSLTNSGTITSSGIINFIPASAKAINLGTNFSSNGLVNFGGSGAISLTGTPVSFNDVLISNTHAAGITPSSAWSIGNNFTVNNGSIFNAGNYSHSIAGNILNSGIINSGASTINLNGTAGQTVYSGSAFNNITVNKASGAATLLSDVTISGALNFISGSIQTGVFTIIQSSSATVTGAAQNTGWVNGKLQKYVSAGAPVINYEIGDAANYTPVTLVFASVTGSGNVTAYTTAGDHPDVISSGINPFKSVNRFYTLNNSGVTFTNYTATFNFATADVDAGATTSQFNVALQNGSAWILPVTASPNLQNIQAANVTQCGDFAIGEICNKGTAISYPGSPYCTNAGTATVTLAGTSGGSFSAGSGLLVDALTGAINLAASIAGTYTVTYTIPAYGDCGQYITSTSVSVGTENTWTGTIDGDWNNPNNWACGGVPLSTADVTIPSDLFTYPIIMETVAVHNLTISDGAFVLVFGGVLQTSGSIYNSGTLDVSSGTVELNGSSSQAIAPNTFADNTMQNLIISNNVLLHGQQNITGTLSFGAANKTLYTNDSLALKSTEYGTGNLADITNNGAYSGNNISGKIIIERYIAPKRAWRLLAAPVCSCSAPTVKEAWQEGSTSGNPNPSYGTQITGGTISNGFDQGVNNNAAFKYYNNSTNTFNAMPTTNAPITNYPGYFLFIRGDRSTNLSLGVNAPLTPATLRIKGQVNTGTVAQNVNALYYTVIGNPYPAAVDFHTLTKTNVNDKFYIWDPKIGGASGTGGYVTFVANGYGGYDATAAVSPVSQYIPSGEAFLVESKDGINPGTLTFKETDKNMSGSDQLFRPVYGNEKLRVNLQALNADGSGSLVDGVLTTYSDLNNNKVDRNDALKIYNSAENLWIGRDGKNLAIEKRQTIDGNDTTFLNLSGLKQQKYRLQITTEAMLNSGLQATLKDNYSAAINNTALNMNGATDVNFTVNSSPLSYAANRFSIVFTKQIILQVTFESIKASLMQKNILVEWKMAGEQDIRTYEIQSSLTGISFTKAETINKNANRSVYSWLDKNATEGLHYYRIKAISLNGNESYSSIVQVVVKNTGDNSSIDVYGNNIRANRIALQFKNIQQGMYTIQLFTMDGRLVQKGRLNYAGGSLTENISIDKYLPSGKYQLLLTGKSVNYSTVLVKE